MSGARLDNYFVIGDVITFKVTGQETNDASLIAEVVSQPDGIPMTDRHTPPDMSITPDNDQIMAVIKIYDAGRNSVATEY